MCTFSQIKLFFDIFLHDVTSQVYAWLAVCDKRTLLMAVISTIWSFRLTWNFNRRGGYKWPPWKGDEDYRWSILKEGFLFSALNNPIVWIIFNFTFISFYNSFLLFAISTPSLIAWSAAMSPSCKKNGISTFDGITTFLVLSFILIESIADNQQYAFQTEKNRRRSISEAEKLNSTNMGNKYHKTQSSLWTGDFADGFLHSSGLFTIVRKPNYMAEQAIWICYYFFSISATNDIVNISIIGCVQLCILFQFSGKLTEDITITKYPKYKQYQKLIPLYVPSISSINKSILQVYKKD